MTISQSWNAAQYAQQGRFVADLAGGFSNCSHHNRKNVFSISAAEIVR
jgi:hypothetical protein